MARLLLLQFVAPFCLMQSHFALACRTGWRQDAKGTGRELTTDIKAKKSVAKLNFSGEGLGELVHASTSTSHKSMNAHVKQTAGFWLQVVAGRLAAGHVI